MERRAFGAKKWWAVMGSQRRCFRFTTSSCGRKIQDNYSKTYFCRLINDKSELKTEVQVLCQYLQFPGRGQRNTPCLPLRDLPKLLMMLGGKVADAFKDHTLAILQRYLNGDLSLCKEVKANKQMGHKRSYAKFMNAVLDDAQERMNEELKEMPPTVYIYAACSDTFPGLVKIGRSRDVKARLSSANTFVAPAPHKLLCMAPTFDAPRDEATTHAHFAQYRREGEFFEVSPKQVEAYFKTVITGWYQHELGEHMEHNKGLVVKA